MSDDLVKKLLSQIGDDVQEVYSHEALFRAAAARIAALEAALAPFAAYAKVVKHWNADEEVVSVHSISKNGTVIVTAGDFHRARAAVEAGQ